MSVLKIVAAIVIQLAAVGVAQAAAPCDKRCLLGIAGEYLDSLTANDRAGAPFAADLRSTENGVATAPGQGVWTTAKMWSYRHTFVDPVTGGIGVFGVVAEDGDQKALISVRLKVVDRRITESELMVSRKGDFSLFGTGATDAKPSFRQTVAPEERSTRAELAAIARAYFTGITRADPSGVPFHPDCNRTENGVQTTNNPPRMMFSCAEGLRRFAYMQHFRDTRIPVIDTEHGLVWAITVFDMPVLKRTSTIRGKPYEISPELQRLPRSLMLYELFKVEGGRIREIEALMRDGPLGASNGWPGDGQ
jgi:hypothetical protein